MKTYHEDVNDQLVSSSFNLPSTEQVCEGALVYLNIESLSFSISAILFLQVSLVGTKINRWIGFSLEGDGVLSNFSLQQPKSNSRAGQ